VKSSADASGGEYVEFASEDSIANCSYFVDKSGSDSNNGLSLENAFATPNAAADVVSAGDVVCVGGGTYSRGSDIYVLDLRNIEGTSDRPITFIALDIENSPVFKMQGYSDGGAGAAVYIDKSSHIQIIGISATYGMRGYYVNSSNYITINYCNVYDVGQEAIHIGQGVDQDGIESSNILVENCEVTNTGNRPGTDSNGSPYNWRAEAIYVGTGSGPADYTNNVTIRNNHIHDTFPATSEAIDIKKRTSNILIEDNLIENVDTWCEAAIRFEGSSTNGIVRRNVLRKISASGTGGSGNPCTNAMGLRVNEVGGTDASVVFENNVVWDANRAGICAHGQSGNSNIIFRNNTSFGNSKDYEYDSGTCDGTAQNINNISSDGTWNTTQYTESDFVGPVTSTADAGRGCGVGSGFEIVNYRGEGAQLDFCGVGIQPVK
jgi:hypothetical protein